MREKKVLVVVEVMGPINASKTTLSRRVERILSNRGLKVRFIPDQMEQAEPKGEIAKNTWALREVCNLITLAKTVGDYHVVIVDSGPWTRCASIKTHINSGCHIDDEEERKKAKKAFELAKKETQVIDEDLFVVVSVRPETSFARDQAGEKTIGKVATFEFLTEMQSVYQKINQLIPEEKKLEINGEEDFSKNVDRIVERIEMVLSEKEDIEDRAGARYGEGAYETKSEEIDQK